MLTTYYVVVADIEGSAEVINVEAESPQDAFAKAEIAHRTDHGQRDLEDTEEWEVNDMLMPIGVFSVSTGVFHPAPHMNENSHGGWSGAFT